MAGHSLSASSRHAGDGTAALAVGASKFWFWGAAALVLCLDQFSKYLVAHNMALYQSIPLLGNVLQLTYVRNAGAAFSLLANPSAAPWRLYLLAGVALVTVSVLIFMAYHESYAKAGFLIPLGLVSGGALGNLVDRLSSGTVVDFIEFSYKSFHFPVFNIADSAVNVGVFWILLITFMSHGEEKEKSSAS